MFKFRLEKILSLKKQIELAKQNEYSKVLNRLEEVKRKRQSIVDKQNTAIQELRNITTSGKNFRRVGEYNNYINYLKFVIEKVDYNIEIIKRDLEDKRKELEKAVIDRKILEKFKEKELEKYHQEELKNENSFINEIVSYQYSTREE